MALSTCEQAAVDLQTYKDALAAIAMGTRVADVQHADKRVVYSAANAGLLRDLIRQKQAQVDACNGVRGTQRVLRIIPEDDNGCFRL